MIEVSGLTKLYGEFAAVSDLTFSVQPGELLGLVGPNGAGKTTTLRCAAGIIPPTRGVVRLAGHDVVTDPIAAKQQLAFFPDEPRLFEYLTVRQHLEFTARLFQVADAAVRIPPLLAELDLTGREASLPGELSRGMKQKVAIACGLLHSPRVIFFDEPLTGLDPLAIRRMKNTILRLAAEGAAIVISSHLLALLEELCSHVLIVKQGRKMVHGRVAEVRAQFARDHGAQNLEDVFLQIATADDPRPAVPAPPPIPPPPPAS
jgi:ABC-2 type transport system ATP-binding protein